MMLLQAIGTGRDLGRLHDLASVLIRFGFGDMVRRLGMGKALETAGRLLHWEDARELAQLEPPERIRRAFEEMGPCFVKLGQILSSRIDLLPPEYIAEFAKLQDQAPPVSFEEIRAQLEEDLGATIEDIFATVDPEPLAAASIAQVHRATLKSGEDVVLKARRPGIRPIVEADLRLLARLAEVAEKEIEEARRFRPREIAREFSRSMRREMDLATECRNAERIADSFKDDPCILVPKVYWQWTCERLNVQEYVGGIAGRDLEAVDKAGLDRRLLARRGSDAILKMIFTDGFFHADPHPGNVFYLPGNRIAFIDFGMVGRLSEGRRHELIDLLYGIVEKRPDQVSEILLRWSQQQSADPGALTTEIDAFIDRIHGLPLKALNLVELIADLMALIREHDLVLPSDLTLLSKALISLEGMGRQLDPDFEMIAAAQPFLERAMLARFLPGALLRHGRQGVADLVALMRELPKDLRKIANAAQKGTIRIHVDVDRLEHFADRIDRSASRLTIGIVIAALVMGSSIVMTAAGGEIPIGLSFFAMLGFFAAVLGGIWMIYSIWRRH